MSEGEQPSGVFDLDRIQLIVEMMKQHELSEVDLQEGDAKIKLTRGGVAPLVAAPQAVAAPAAAAPAAADDADTAGTITINAPMVGTFYARANPESDPFVKVGSVISEDTVVCIVEAMKVFNEIPAECSGTVVEILAKDQQAVDFGKPLYRIKPNA